MKTGTNQMRWVILLLGAVVILPTVCLLWFMNQAMENEQLAVKQKLVNVLTNLTERCFVEFPDQYWDFSFERFDVSLNEILDDETYYNTLLPTMPSLMSHDFEGLIVYNQGGKIHWPIVETIPEDYALFDSSLQSAWELEQNKDTAKALETYQQIVQSTNDLRVTLFAMIGQIRCLSKQDRTEEAINLCYSLSYPEGDDIYHYPQAELVMQMRVRLAQFYLETNDPELFYHLRRCLLNSHVNSEKENACMCFPASVELWGLSTLSDIARASEYHEQLKDILEDTANRLAYLERCLNGTYAYSSKASLADWPEMTIRKLSLDRPSYGIYKQYGDKTVLFFIDPPSIIRLLKIGIEDWSVNQDDSVMYCIYNDQDELLAGDDKYKESSFTKISMGTYMPDWHIYLAFKDENVFDSAANKQAAIYQWIGILGAAMILICGGLAIATVNRQIKMNRLKNDFIATVTHELKTPLSSMRVLVDTLIDGNYHEEKQAEDYLHLISKENTRLSRLIDNFLTFSRMERNKNAFIIQNENAREIAEEAVGIIHGRLNGNKEECHIDMQIDSDLADVRADRDAMITVLVNLLDNACKYSGEKKSITLKVSGENGTIRFCVKDNGIGMNRRQAKRAFERFYQADSSLSRKAEGTGLGLAIVKFIVDSHHGHVSLESEPEKGTEVTVLIPKA